MSRHAAAKSDHQWNKYPKSRLDQFFPDFHHPINKSYTSGQLDETRHFYYTDPQKWQVIEERLESSGSISENPDRQFVWGLRYIDAFVLRDRDTDFNGSLDERLYALQDANWNVTAVANTSGEVQERYAYSAYGTPRVLTPTFAARASSNSGAEVSYAGYRYDDESGLLHVRNRMLHASLGCWLQRDGVGYADGVSLYCYVAMSPTNMTDSFGLFAENPYQSPVTPPANPGWWATSMAALFGACLGGAAIAVAAEVIAEYFANGRIGANCGATLLCGGLSGCLLGVCGLTVITSFVGAGLTLGAALLAGAGPLAICGLAALLVCNGCTQSFGGGKPWYCFL